MAVEPRGFGDCLIQFGQALQEGVRPFHEIPSAIMASFNPPSPQEGASSVESTFIDRKIRLMQLRSHSIIIKEKYLPAKEDRLGYIPVLGSILGVVHILNAVYLLGLTCIFKILEWHSGLKNTNFGQMFPQDDNLFHVTLRNFVRGLCELVPIIGGLSLYLYDTIRLNNLYEEMMTAKAREYGINDYKEALLELEEMV